MSLARRRVSNPHQFNSIMRGGQTDANCERNDDGKYFLHICLLDATKDFFEKMKRNCFMDFNPFLTVNCKTWESKFVRCHVPSDHCVWSDLFQRALKSLTGRWWRGGTRHFHWCWDLPLESHPIISFQWISPDFGIYPGLQTRFPWIRRLCFQILSSLILRHCSALLQRNALECLVEMYPQCKEQSLLRKSSSQ